MYIPGLGFFLVFLIIVFWVSRKINTANKNYGQDLVRFLHGEQEANFARKKEIPQNLFFKPDISTINFKRVENGGSSFLKNCYNNVLEQSKKTMLKFEKEMSNKDIKLTYGATNLEYITEYEENYSSFIHCLNAFAAALYEECFYEEAEIILLLCVDCGSDVSKTYMLLADVYVMQNDINKLKNLTDIISKVKMTQPIQEKIITYIKDKF